MTETTASGIRPDPAPPPDLQPGPDSYACARDYHLFGPGSKRILALDGGGVRGAISVAFLERIEQIFAQRQRDLMGQRREGLASVGAHNGGASATEPEAFPIRLADHFDLIGGTSTGAIIAGALALGNDTEQIRAFYLEKAKIIFPRRRWRVQVLRLEKGWLKKHLGLTFTDRDLARFHRMDDVRNIAILYELAQVAALIQVKEEHFFPRRDADSAPSVFRAKRRGGAVASSPYVICTHNQNSRLWL